MPPLSSALRLQQSYYIFFISKSPVLSRRSCRSGGRWRRRPVGAVKCEESQSDFELDREKARQALRKFDEQLQSLVQTSPTPRRQPPSLPLSDGDADRPIMSGMVPEELPTLSGSYLAYSAVALLILTVLNNIVFSVFIKPSIDGPEAPVRMDRVPLTEPWEQQAPQISD